MDRHDETASAKRLAMGKVRRHSAAEMAEKLQRAAEIIAAGKTVGQACQELSISKQTLYRWRAANRKLVVSEAQRIAAVKEENQRLRRLVAEQALRIQELQDDAQTRESG